MTKPSPPLFAALAKVRNAHTKIRELSVLINSFLRDAKVTIRAEAHEGFTYIIGGLDCTPGEDIFLKTGEAAVQLRDALDKMTVALARLNGRGASGVSFPFAGLDKVTGKPQPFPPTRRTDTEKKLTPQQWALILAQKPHPGGNDTLWAVNQLANCDKHWEGLIDVRIKPVLSSFTVANGFIEHLETSPDWPKGLVQQHETERALLRSSGNLPDSNGRAGVAIVLGEIPPLSGRDVLITLHRQAAEVQRIVQLFLRTFF